MYAALLNYFANTPSYFVMVDSTDNRSIKEYDFKTYLENEKSGRGVSTLSNEWSDFLMSADVKKNELVTYKIRKIKSIHIVKLVNDDTLLKVLSENYQINKGFANVYKGANGWMSVSSILFSDNRKKAIVEIRHTKGTLNARGETVLIEKNKKGKWMVVKQIGNSVS